EYYHPAERVLFDIKEYLFQEILLREKDFRAFVKSYDWSEMEGKNVAIYCSSDAIIPSWAYMLLSSAIAPYANKVVFGDLQDLEQALYQEALSKVDWEQYRDAKIVLKGRSEEHTSELQSRENLVCRLLLEKKKKRTARARAAGQLN